jgi:prevent-host-death family protein
MKAAGLRELENRLNEYIREVRRGERVLITDRGVVVAELVPPGHPPAGAALPPGLQALVSRDQATVGLPNDFGAYPLLEPVLAPGRAAALLAAERASR